MKTVIHAYRYDVTKPDERAAYEALRAKMKVAGVECFEAWGQGSHYLGGLDGREIELETKHLFNNQWNTAPLEAGKNGLRVFDWAQDYPIDFSKTIKRGHWLDLTDEMRAIRASTNACGCCGHQEPAAKGSSFYPQCIGSEYLKVTELHLTRMQPVACVDDRAALTEAERARLLPIYKRAQLHGHTERDKKRIAKARADVIAEAERVTRSAKIKRDGFLWFMDRGIRTDNLIYYSHTDRFCFGWRQPVDDELRAAVLEVVAEFPYAYDLKLADGRTLSGG